LAVRFAGCDARFDGVSAGKARDLLEELGFDWNRTIPQGSEWSDPVAQEAIRTLFWARFGAQASLPVWDESEGTPPSPSRSISTSSDGLDSFSNRAQPPADHRRSSVLTTFFWLFVHRWWIFLNCVWTQVGGLWRRAVD
jgi:hypothetical protein